MQNRFIKCKHQQYNRTSKKRNKSIEIRFKTNKTRNVYLVDTEGKLPMWNTIGEYEYRYRCFVLIVCMHVFLGSSFSLEICMSVFLHLFLHCCLWSIDFEWHLWYLCRLSILKNNKQEIKKRKKSEIVERFRTVIFFNMWNIRHFSSSFFVFQNDSYIKLTLFNIECLSSGVSVRCNTAIR